MSSSATNYSICLLAADTNLNWKILTIMSSVVILDISSVILLSIYLLCYLTNKALHLNLRALTTTITVALILRNVFTCIRAVRMIVFAIVSVVSLPLY